MYRDQTRSWFKHLDFMVLDIICMQLCFTLSYWLYVDFSNPYRMETYQFQAILITVSQLVVMLFTNNYQGILRRSRTEEALAVLRYVSAIFIVALVYLFVVHQSAIASRMQFGLTALIMLVLDYLLRQANKIRIRKIGSQQKKSLVIITSRELAPKAIDKLMHSKGYLDYFVKGIILLDGEPTEEILKLGVPVMRLGKESIDNMSHDWVDEVFILQPENYALPPRLMNDLFEMGMVVNYASAAMSDGRWPVTEMRKMGDISSGSAEGGEECGGTVDYHHHPQFDGDGREEEEHLRLREGDGGGDHQPEERAGGAHAGGPGVPVGQHEEDASEDTAEKVERKGFGFAEALFDHASEEPHTVHIKEEVPEIRVEELVGHQPPELPGE